MRVRFEEGAALITDAADFEPRHIFECGQCFRFSPSGAGYAGVACGRVLHVEKTGDSVKLWPCGEEDYRAVWHGYFDMDTDYAALLDGLPDDEYLQASVRFGRGLRVLRQPPFETLISFILSSNNNVGRIRGLIDRLCRAFGAPLTDGFYDFPDANALAAASPADIVALGAGYRAPYIVQASRAVAGGFGLERLACLPYQTAKKELQKLPGVGPKVADCVLLFSLGHRCAFVQDVWIKRVLRDVYGVTGSGEADPGFLRARFGAQGGIVQQYLFHYARCGSRP
jgi:N-glycosylase/DNA lyase